MGNSGQPGGFGGGNAEEIDFPLRQNTGTGCDLMDMLFRMSETSESPQNPTTGTQFNNQQNGFPVAPGSDQTNMNVQITGTIDCQQHGQRVGTSHQISFSGQPSSDQTNTNVQRTGGTPKLSPEQAEKKRKIDKAYREKKKKEKIETEIKLKELDDENKKLKNKIADLEGANTDLESANASMIENLQSKTEMIDKLKSDLDELKQESEKENAIQRKLLKITDFKKFINEGSKHYKEPTQDSFSSYEERLLEEEIFAGTKHAALDGDDSGDENGDSKRKRKQAAPSATSERCSGKVPKVKGMYDELMETRQVTLAAKKLSYDARADQREGSTSNPTAMVIDAYSITECLRILKTMGGIPYSIVKKARAKFESPDERQYFVGLIDEDWRRGWVKDLEDS